MYTSRKIRETKKQCKFCETIKTKRQDPHEERKGQNHPYKPYPDHTAVAAVFCKLVRDNMIQTALTAVWNMLSQSSLQTTAATAV